MRFVTAIGAMPAPAVANGMFNAVPVAEPRMVDVEAWVPVAGGGDDALAQRTGGPESKDLDVRAAVRNGQKVLAYARSEFGRSSFDGRGATLKLRVHAPDPATGEDHVNNAFWDKDEQRVWLGDGDGAMFRPLGGADDVIAHEFFHGVIDSEIHLEYEGQEGALHESFADVLATGVDGNWQIAEDVFTPTTKGDALRDMEHPTYSDWRTFPDWNDEVHEMSEVPSRAAFLVGKQFGASTMRKIWYSAVVDHLQDHAGFAGARDATIAAAQTLFGSTSVQAQAVIDAWTAVGIMADTPKDSGPFGPIPFPARRAPDFID